MPCRGLFYNNLKEKKIRVMGGSLMTQMASDFWLLGKRKLCFPKEESETNSNKNEGQFKTTPNSYTSLWS